MKRNREAELIACCQSIIRNVPDIMKDWRYDQGLAISIEITPYDPPATVIVTKTVVPEEVINIYRGESDDSH